MSKNYNTLSHQAAPNTGIQSNNPKEPLILKLRKVGNTNDLEIEKRKQKKKNCCHKLHRDCRHRWHFWCSKINWQYIGNSVYDILNIIITIADIITDSLVTYNFYINDQMTFFWISLTIVIIAQIAYAFAFVTKYIENNVDNWEKSIFWFFIALLFSPIMSFVFFLTSSRDRWLSKIFMDVFDLHIPKDPDSNNSYTYSTYGREFRYLEQTEDTPRIKQWIEMKFRRHVGFIIESTFEAFPQVLNFCCLLLFFI